MAELLTSSELDFFRRHINMNGLLNQETINKINNILEANTYKKFPIVHCCNPTGKCSCDTFDEMNGCKYQS